MPSNIFCLTNSIHKNNVISSKIRTFKTLIYKYFKQLKMMKNKIIYESPAVEYLSSGMVSSILAGSPLEQVQEEDL